MDFIQFFDIIVIGGGPAGYHFANLAAKKGFTVALFEERALGGTCLNEGCIPSKAILKSAKLVDGIKHAEEFGVEVQEYSIKQEFIIERKNKIVSKLAMGVRGGLRKNKVKLFFAHADILPCENENFLVECENKVYGASKLVIATGSKVFIPKIEGVGDSLNSGFAITSTEALDLTKVPTSILIVGAGVIGIELASYFSSMGSKVTVVEATDKICAKADRECSELLMKNLCKKGVNFMLNSKVTAIHDGAVVVQHEEEILQIDCDRVLLCVGRIANISGFGLDNLSVEYTNKGIIVDKNMQTNVKNLFAIGDVNGKVMLAHTAYKEAEVCFDYINGKENFIDYNSIPAVIYCSPEFSYVGITEEDAINQNLNCTVKKLPMIYSGRFVAENIEVDGLCKVIIDNNKNTVIGAMMVGDGSSEVILSLSNFITLGITVDDINKMIFPHPTIGEIIKDTINQ